MVDFVNVADLVESNGKTVRENNRAQRHTIPIGTLVEINCDYLENYHGTRQFIAAHTRDCDGTPLYSLTADRSKCNDRIEFDDYGERRSQEYIDLYRRVSHNGSWGADALITVNGPSTRFSALLELNTTEEIEKAIGIYHEMGRAEENQNISFNFHVKFSDDQENLIIYNEHGITNHDMICKYLLRLCRELDLSGALTITYADIISVNALEENGGGIFFADFDEEEVYTIDIKNVSRMIASDITLCRKIASEVYQ